jgi:AcrR family transcriptional regulator
MMAEHVASINDARSNGDRIKCIKTHFYHTFVVLKATPSVTRHCYVEAHRYRPNPVSTRKSTASRPDSRGKLAPGLRLPREQVIESQRDRLLAAVTDLAAERGAQATAIQDLLDRAAVSRGSFYEIFANKNDCLLQAYRTHVERVEAQVLVAYRGPNLQGIDALRAAIAALLEWVIASPAAAQLCTAEIASSGMDAIEQRNRCKAAWEVALAKVLGQIHLRGPDSVLVCGVLAGVEQLIHNRASSGQAHMLAGSENDLLSWILTYDRSPGREDPPRADPHSENNGSLVVARDAALDPRAGPAPRERITAAVLRLAAAKGYRATNFRDIARAASISLSTFYKHFGSKRDAFLAAFDECAQEIGAATDGTLDPAAAKPESVRDAIAALLGYLAGHRDIARIALVDIYSADKPGIERVDRLLARYSSVPILDGGRRIAAPPDVCTLVTGGIAGILHQQIAADQYERLTELTAPLTYFVLAPLVGSERAFSVATERR